MHAFRCYIFAARIACASGPTCTNTLYTTCFTLSAHITCLADFSLHDHKAALHLVDVAISLTDGPDNNNSTIDTVAACFETWPEDLVLTFCSCYSWTLDATAVWPCCNLVNMSVIIIIIHTYLYCGKVVSSAAVCVFIRDMMWCDRKRWMTDLQQLNRTKSTWLQPWSRHQRSSSSHWMEALLAILTLLLQQCSPHMNDLQGLILSWTMLCMFSVLLHPNVHRSTYVSLILYVQVTLNWDAVIAWGPRVGPGHPSSPLSIYFLIFSPFTFSFLSLALPIFFFCPSLPFLPE